MFFATQRLVLASVTAAAIILLAAPAEAARKARNIAPTISGTPSTTVSAGGTYAFKPSAYDANGDTLRFSISGKPLWAGFSSTTGALTGVPSEAYVGVYSNIVITVTDGKFKASLPAFSIVVSAPAPANNVPTISGSPVVAAVVGQPYAFQATAHDADGDKLAFSVANKPAWATFESATGLLYGTPGAGDVGTAPEITIAVTDGKATSKLAPFSITTNAAPAGSATLSWMPPTQNADGSPLTDLAGYKVSYGTASRSYVTTLTLGSPGMNSVVIEDLKPGTYFFAVQAVNSAGVVSDFSNEAVKVL